jgi:PAS domain S-box-containing protein
VSKTTEERSAQDELVRQQARATRLKGKAVIATDTAGRILYWNDAAQEIYGWRREEVLNLNIVDVTPAALSRPEAAHIMKILRSGEHWSGTFQLQDRRGRRFLANVTDTPVFNANGKLIGIIGISAPAQSSRAQSPRTHSPRARGSPNRG